MHQRHQRAAPLDMALNTKRWDITEHRTVQHTIGVHRLFSHRRGSFFYLVGSFAYQDARSSKWQGQSLARRPLERILAQPFSIILILRPVSRPLVVVFLGFSLLHVEARRRRAEVVSFSFTRLGEDKIGRGFYISDSDGVLFPFFGLHKTKTRTMREQKQHWQGFFWHAQSCPPPRQKLVFCGCLFFFHHGPCNIYFGSESESVFGGRLFYI